MNILKILITRLIIKKIFVLNIWLSSSFPVGLVHFSLRFLAATDLILTFNPHSAVNTTLMYQRVQILSLG